MSMWGTAEALYGVPTASVGTTTAQPAASSTSAPSQAVTGKPHLLAQPSFWVVVVLAAAIGLVHVSLRLQ
ncbi:MAG TPA: hypothetical protein VFN61_04500 [Acidimicrobiales bacterium]|nr:hypothetical protein [Acidimicrobiales bacterium]